MAVTERKPEIRQEDLWAWIVGFVVTTSLHVGIVLFTVLSIALAIYALASAFANVPIGVQTVAWFFTILSLTVWGLLIKVQARGLGPHTIRGIGKIVVVTSGCEWGEIAADVGSGLIGLAYIGPLLWSLSTGSYVSDPLKVTTAPIGALFVIVGWGSLILRFWLHRRRRADTKGK